MSRLKAQWLAEHATWRTRDLAGCRYVYWWADGVYSHVRMDDKLCLLVIIGVTAQGRKELVAVEDGYRESEARWAALAKLYPETRHQRCWVHKTANILEKLPKSMQPKVRADLRDIWMAPTRVVAEAAFDRTLQRYRAKYPKAMTCLAKDRDVLLTFYDFPAEHWVHIRTSNPIESTFATVRLRSNRSRNCGSRDTILAMVFKLLQNAAQHRRCIKGFTQLELVVNNVRFQDGEPVTESVDKVAA